MARSYDTASLVTLPRLDGSGADAIVTELLSLSKGKKFPARVEGARKALAQRQKELQAALTARLQAQPASDTARAKLADQAEDAAFSATFEWLSGFAKLPGVSEETALADKLLAALFPDGLKFTQLPYKLEWSEGEARLRAVADNDQLARAFSTLGGDLFLRTLRRVHKEYGEALGITTARPAPAATSQVKEPLDAVRAALRTYALMVLAHNEGAGDPEADPETHELLAPLVAWQSRAAKGKGAVVVDPSPSPPPAPNPPTA
jgi:hypothetical protein